MYKGGSPQNGMIFWRVSPLLYRLALLDECSRNPSVSMFQVAVLWEAVFGFSEFYLNTLSMLAHFRCVIYSAPAHTVLSSFEQKLHDPWAPPSLFTQSHSEWLFFVSLDEKSPQREMFCLYGRGETNKKLQQKA